MSSKYTFDIRDGILIRYHGEAENIIIPSEVEKIGKAAFARTGIREIILPEGITEIGEQAFESCENLSYVQLPESLTEISEGAFGCCRSLRNVRFSEGLQKLGRYAFFKCNSLQRIELPDTLSEIGNEAFGYCTNLREIVLPMYLKEIGRYALGGCDNLETVTYPKDTALMRKAFLTTQNMIRVIIPEGVTSLRFRGIPQSGENVREIILPQSLVHIENHGLSDYPNLRSISFPNGANEYLKKTGGIRIYNSPALVLDDYFFGIKFLIGPAFDDYDSAVLAGFLSQLRKNLEFNIDSHKPKLSRILRNADADISKKELGAKTLGGLLRLVILERHILSSVEAINMILKSEIFSKDAEIISILIEERHRLAGDSTDSLLL